MVFEVIALLWDSKFWLLVFMVMFGITLTNEPAMSSFLNWIFSNQTLADVNIVGLSTLYGGLTLLIGTVFDLDFYITYFVKSLIILEVFMPPVMGLIKWFL